jgi:hypothetical protein
MMVDYSRPLLNWKPKSIRVIRVIGGKNSFRYFGQLPK